jgi:tRNA(Ile)-lysidine synthase
VVTADDRSARQPIGDAEADALFADLADEKALILAVSGGPDSTALLYLAARWQARRKPAPKLFAVTIDHGLRPESRDEAAAVLKFARKLGVAHRTLRWRGTKPSSGVQEKARAARYRLLRDAARKAKARRVLTGHTLDDQAETVLLRMARGSGLAGIAGMSRAVALAGLLSSIADEVPRPAAPRPQPRAGAADMVLVRPFLHVPKSRLIATLRAAGIPYAEDPSNEDPRFTRARLRRLMPSLAEEGLTAHRLAHLARRVRRSEAAIEAIVDWAAERLGLTPDRGRLGIGRSALRGLPADIALRLLGRAIDTIGDEGPVELGKLEALSGALAAAMASGSAQFRRTLAGAMVSLQSDSIIIERAPARRPRRRA